MKCPKCGSNNVAIYQYGEPVWDEKFQQQLDAGKVRIGGCLMREMNPTNYCNDCEEDIGRPPIIIKEDGSFETYMEAVTEIRLSLGGFPRGYQYIEVQKELDGGALLIAQHSPQKMEGPYCAHITAEEWNHILEKLYNEMHLHEWNDSYRNDKIIDGTQWSIKVRLTNERTRKYGGSNAFPGYWEEYMQLVTDLYARAKQGDDTLKPGLENELIEFATKWKIIVHSRYTFHEFFQSTELVEKQFQKFGFSKDDGKRYRQYFPNENIYNWFEMFGRYNYGQHNDIIALGSAIYSNWERLRNKHWDLNDRDPDGSMEWFLHGFLELADMAQNLLEQREGKLILFFKETDVWGEFSNWYPATFVIDDFAYSCVEQYMMAQKAKLFHDSANYTAILKAEKPAVMKHLGRDVEKHPNYDLKKWTAVNYEIVKTANRAKFEQNPELKKLLLKTQAAYLAEVNPNDPFWGIGLSEDAARSMPRASWPKCENKLGRILMELRDEFRRE